jgi:carboxyl-terminal processing protease
MLSLANMWNRFLAPILLLALSVGTLTWVLTSPFWQTLFQISAVIRLVHDGYVDEEAVSFERLRRSALTGIMDSLDRNSSFMAREEVRRFEETTRQRYVGIGVEIQALRGRVTIMQVYEDGAAAAAGLLAGDQIIEVNGEDAREWTVGDVADQLRGPDGERVSLSVYRPLESEEMTVSLRRRAVRVATVRNHHVDEDRIAFFTLRQFGHLTASEVESALRGFRDQGARALIIDLRDNPGGTLESAKDVVDFFLPPGELITYLEGRRARDRLEFRARREALWGERPVAVIINESSASGSEIVAGALQDAGRAFVVGARSFGKGSVQTVFTLRSGDAIRQTTARYFLPSGRSIDEVGVEPDVPVEFSSEERAELIIQSRHREILDAAAFEEVFGFPPDRVDRPLEAAREVLREALRSESQQA